MLTRIICFLTAFYFWIFPNVPYGYGQTEKYGEMLCSQVDYLQQLTQADGSITMARAVTDTSFASLDMPTVDSVDADVYTTWRSAKICPYFSCIAVIGLLEASPDSARQIAERYIAWHFAHLNESDINGLDGTIYDYRIFTSDGIQQQTVCVPLCDIYGSNYAYDSTDSYAALFLKLLKTYMSAFPDSDLLTTKRRDIDRVVDAMLSTYVPTLALTTAKPGYDVCYLMDNCEVYEGLLCAGEIYSHVYEDEKKADDSNKIAAKVKCSINTLMYSPFFGAYYSSLFSSGIPSSKVTSKALKSFYPEGTSQLFPILCGVIGCDSFRAQLVYRRFNDNFGTQTAGKSWMKLDVGADFPWALIGKAAVLMNDGERAQQYFDCLNETYFSKNCPYPYYCAEAGHTLSALLLLLKQSPTQSSLR